MLSRYGANPTPIEFLAKRLGAHYEVLAKSPEKQKWARLWDGVKGLLQHRNQVNLVIIDLYAYQSFWYSFIIGMLANLLQKPYVLYLHSDQLKKKYKQWPRTFKYFIGQSRAIVAPSPYLKTFFQAKGYDCLEIPNFINFPDYKSRIRATIHPHLVWIRAFHKNYNPVLAIEVMKLLIKRFPEATLTMMGPVKDGTYHQVVQKIEEYSLENQVSLMDKQDKARLIEICQEKDVFLNTSQIDNQPITLIEAMAMGFPVVSTNAGGIPQLINDGQEGTIVEKNNPQMMADQIAYLLNNPEQCKMISQNAIKKARKFDWTNGKQKWIDLIEELTEAA